MTEDINELRISGKVTTSFINNDGHFCCTFVNTHDHVVNNYNNKCDSFFRAFLPDVEKSKNIDIIRGDRVMITGYLKQEILNNGKKRNQIYIKEIELIRPKFDYNIDGFSRSANT